MWHKTQCRACVTKLEKGKREKGKANFGNVPNGAEFAQFVAIKLPRRHAEMCIRMENTHTLPHTGVPMCVAYFLEPNKFLFGISRTLLKLYKVGKQINKV